MSERRGRPPGDGRGRRPDSTIPDGIGEAEDAMMQGLDDADMAALLPPLDGFPGPARRLSSARTARMVSEIVDAASAQPHEAAAVPVPLSPFDVTRSVIFEPPAEARPRGVARHGLVMAAALVVASVGSTAAGVWIAMRERPQAAEPPRAASAPAAEREPVRRARVQTPAAVGSAPAEAPEPARIDDEAPAGDPLDEPEQTEQIEQFEQIDDSGDAADPAEDAGEDAADATDADRPRRSQRARRRALRQRRERAAREAARSREAATRDVEPPEPAMPRHTEPARREPVVMLPADAPVEDIVALANQQRKEKRWRAAEALYERVMRDHARTDAAAIATVASASLHLDHLADPAGALRRFRQALRLRPDGPLAEEARWGLAETYRALGDVEEERAALDRFLSAHPRSVNAARARQRLTELGAGR
jgi:tetratricopeptide (TPR) repeat protein